MAAGSWRALYASDLQSLWALVAVPAAFLVWLLARGRRRLARDADPRGRFVASWAIAFALETIADPVATGPVARALELEGGAAEALPLVFVLLGDWRVWLLVAALVLPPARRRAAFAGSALATLVVPALAYGAHAALRARWPDLPGQVLWLVYETAFAALALWVRARGLSSLAPAADARALRAARAVLAWAVATYLLWAAADLLVLAGVDAGWALRMLPNQLYYALFVPFAFWAWFGLARARGAERAAPAARRPTREPADAPRAEGERSRSG